MQRRIDERQQKKFSLTLRQASGQTLFVKFNLIFKKQSKQTNKYTEGGAIKVYFINKTERQQQQQPNSKGSDAISRSSFLLNGTEEEKKVFKSILPI